MHALQAVKLDYCRDDDDQIDQLYIYVLYLREAMRTTISRRIKVDFLLELPIIFTVIYIRLMRGQ
jgi:hypothetical protein